MGPATLGPIAGLACRFEWLHLDCSWACSIASALNATRKTLPSGRVRQRS